jgi:hypothetical protein
VKRGALRGALATGAGLACLVGAAGAPRAQDASPNPGNVLLPPVYSPGVGPGIVTFDVDRSLHTIACRSIVVGVRYQLPFARGRAAWVSTMWSRTTSSNLVALTPPTESGGEWDHGRYWDANIFVALWRALEGSLSFQDTRQTFGDRNGENRRAEVALSYYF